MAVLENERRTLYADRALARSEHEKLLAIVEDLQKERYENAVMFDDLRKKEADARNQADHFQEQSASLILKAGKIKVSDGV